MMEAEPGLARVPFVPVSGGESDRDTMLSISRAGAG